MKVKKIKEVGKLKKELTEYTIKLLVEAFRVGYKIALLDIEKDRTIFLNKNTREDKLSLKALAFEKMVREEM